MRRAFRFRLARVQRVRDAEERLARAAWGEAQAAAHEAADRRERRARALADARSELVRILEAGPVDPVWLGSAQEALGNGVIALRRAHEQARTLAERAERFALAWRERDRDRRALAKLEERARARHRAELERAEALEQDERALSRAASPGPPGPPEPGSPRDRAPIKPRAESADQG